MAVAVGKKLAMLRSFHRCGYGAGLCTGAVPLSGGLAAGPDRLADLAPRQALFTGGTHRVRQLTFCGVASPGGELDRHDRRHWNILVTGLGFIVFESIGEFVGAGSDVVNGTSGHECSPQILGSGRAHGVDDGDDAVPLDHTDFHEGAGAIGADEHRHRVVLHEMAEGETERVEHRRIRDSVPMGTVQDDRL